MLLLGPAVIAATARLRPTLAQVAELLRVRGRGRVGLKVRVRVRV